MNTKQVALAVALLAALCLSCGGGDDNPLAPTVIQGSGVPTTESRTVAIFDEVTFTAVGDVNITFGLSQSVSVTVDDNIMQYIQTVHSGSQLIIRIQDGINANDYGLSVDIVMADLDAANLTGVGSIVGQNLLPTDDVSLSLSGVGTIILDLEANSVTSILSGVGNIVLSGAVDNHISILSGVGDLNAFNLETDTTIFTLSGQGSAEVNVTGFLNVTISGIGSVFYRGSPTINAVITGFGQVIDAN